jgi:hypothetical protein
MRKPTSSIRRFSAETAILVTVLAIASPAFGATYQVGPGKPYATLGAVKGLLLPGDIVKLYGDASYAGGVAFTKNGTASQKITIQGIRVNGKRPVISGGYNTVEAAGDHYIFEGLDLTAGSMRCFFHHAHNVTLRDSVIHDCPSHGILGAVDDSGSLLVEYTEIHHTGSGDKRHQIYMHTDQGTHPGSVFRLQHCYIHDGNGGNNVKSRAERNEIYYNWIEGAYYHEVELIGPGAAGGIREDSDVVGNVLRKKNTFFVNRFGGDGSGETDGRYRFVNNTVITQSGGSAVFRFFDGLQSVEMHNNVFFALNGGIVKMIHQTYADWSTGQSLIAGSNNWVMKGSTSVPSKWTSTIFGTIPGFVNVSTMDVRVNSTSPLVNAGASTTSGPPGYPFPNPLAKPLRLPPLHKVEALGGALVRPVDSLIDIGAYEYAPSSVTDSEDAESTTLAFGDTSEPDESGDAPFDEEEGSEAALGYSCRMAASTPSAFAWILALAPLAGIARRHTRRRNRL